MSEFTQTSLGQYLGVWKYQDKSGSVKYYSVRPTGNKFIIRWGDTLEALDTRKEHILIDDSEEAYRRILSKARGGYELVGSIGEFEYTPKCYDAFDTIPEVLALEKSEYRKRKPRKRKLSLLEWMDGLDEYRENDQP